MLSYRASFKLKMHQQTLAQRPQYGDPTEECAVSRSRRDLTKPQAMRSTTRKRDQKLTPNFLTSWYGTEFFGSHRVRKNSVPYQGVDLQIWPKVTWVLGWGMGGWTRSYRRSGYHQIVLEFASYSLQPPSHVHVYSSLSGKKKETCVLCLTTLLVAMLAESNVI